MIWFLIFAIPMSLVTTANLERAGEFRSLEQCREAALAATDPRGHYCLSFPKGRMWESGALIDLVKITRSD